MRSRIAILIVALTVLPCCRHPKPKVQPEPERRGTSEMELVPAPLTGVPADGYEQQPEPRAAPTTLKQALSAYPPSALEDEVQCSVRLLYHIGVDGVATVVRLDWDLPPPAEHLAAFEEAVRSAVASWEFLPGKRYERYERPDGAIAFRERVVPTAGNAVIRFRVVDGRAVVE